MLNLHNKVRIWTDLFNYNRKRTKKFAKYDFDIFVSIKETLEKYSRSQIYNKAILDIGCGQRYPNVLLFSSLSNKVTGIDLEVIGKRFSTSKYYQILKVNGSEKFVKVLVREILFDGLYYETLKNLSGVTFSSNVDLRIADATNMPFESASFDIAISNSAFEHISNVPKAVSELRRVLKNRGLCHIEIHLFTSLSGGHNLKWAFPDESPPLDVPPWDHLRENRFPTHVYLNGLREHEYRKIFADKFEILDCFTEYWEGEKFLTPEIQNELRCYSKEELLKRSIIVIGRKI